MTSPTDADMAQIAQSVSTTRTNASRAMAESQHATLTATDYTRAAEATLAHFAQHDADYKRAAAYNAKTRALHDLGMDETEWADEMETAVQELAERQRIRFAGLRSQKAQHEANMCALRVEHTLLQQQFDVLLAENTRLAMESKVDKNTSDGYHTFAELYEHRYALFELLMLYYHDTAWKSKLHEDGTMFDSETFIAGIETPEGQLRYHLPMCEWDRTHAKEIPNAPAWDGKGSDETIARIRRILA